MKVSKEPGIHSGFYIHVKIGNRICKSFFSAPNNSVDHAGLQYLKDRFPTITTKKRAIEFKKQYKKLWIDGEN